jgi:flagellar biosynthesis/type III secretory pathway M-ring protein FliF/YscJ
MAAMGVQGAFLYRAIFDVPTFVSWMLWLGVFVVLLVGFIHRGIKDARLNRAEQAARDAKFEEQEQQKRTSSSRNSDKRLGTSLPDDWT